MPRRMPRRLLPALALGASALLLLSGAAGQAATRTTGTVGIGDPYYPTYGNGGYDVQHYDIHVAYAPRTDRLTGHTVITATTTQILSRFDLDLVLPASSVTVNGATAAFTQTTHELVVTPSHPLHTGAPMTVDVRYAGIPSQRTDHGVAPWIRTADGACAVGEPEMAAWWFPGNDHPRDKATYDVRVSVPRGTEAVGNGVPRGSTATATTRTWRWQEATPMASYLAFFCAGQFDVTTGTTPDGLPVYTAVASGGGSAANAAKADLARSAEVVDFEVSKFGPYPFDALGGVAPAADFGFALENQTRPVYSRVFWSGGRRDVLVVVHELAHQWFGDSVSVQNWRDMWLNEGFATYAEWLWTADHGGADTASLFSNAFAAHGPSSSFWTLHIGNPGAGHEFDAAVYDRGAMTLQALRTRIGNDTTFFALLKQWASSRADGNGSIADFIALAEVVSHTDLEAFFNVWLFTGSRPAITAANGFPSGFTARANPGATRMLARMGANHRLMR